MNALHPLFQQIAQIACEPALMTAAELSMHHQAIDAAMLADKAVDGHGQRNQARALDLQIQNLPEQWV